MKNELNRKNKDNTEQLINSIKKNIISIKKDFENNIITPIYLYDLNEDLYMIKIKKDNKFSDIINLFDIEYLFFFRILMVSQKSLRKLVLQILRNCIEINPLFTNKILDANIPIIICKIFEDKNSSFEERYGSLKVIYSWLKLSDINFPLIFPQAIASISKTDDLFKIGCLEFLRETSLIRTDLCSTVGGFRILINSMIEIKLPKNLLDKIINSLKYIVNTPIKRKYFNGFGDFDKIFAIFTKSDFSSSIKNNSNNGTKKQKEETKEEIKKLEMKLDSAIYIIKNMLFSWPGYFLSKYDALKIKSLSLSLNNEVNFIIKRAILKLFKEILEIANNYLDNFNFISSKDNDIFYINKIFIAYLVQNMYEDHLNDYLFQFLESSDNNELKDLAFRIALKVNILFTKLSNDDLMSPFIKDKIEKMKWFDNLKNENNIYEEGGNIKNNFNAIYFSTEYEKQKAPIKIKIMFILDYIFHHLNCSDTHLLNPNTLSTEIIISIHSLLNLDIINQYENQYSIGNCKKELI